MPPLREGTPPSGGMAPSAASIPPLSPLTSEPPLVDDEATATGCPFPAFTLPLLRVLVPLPPPPRAAADDCVDEADEESAALSLLTGAGKRPSRFSSRLRRLLECTVFDFFFEGPERMRFREPLREPPDLLTKSPSEPMVVGVALADTSCSPKHSTCIDGVPCIEGVLGDPCQILNIIKYFYYS